MEKEMTLSNSEGKEYIFKLRLDEDSIHFYLKEKNVYAPFSYENSFTFNDFCEKHKAFKACDDLGEIFKVTMGQSPQGTSVSENDNGMEFHQGKIYFGEDYLLPSNQYTDEVTKIADVGSVLLCVRAPVGIVNISKREICIGRGLCAIKAISKISERFILFFLRAFQQSFIKQSTGTTFKAITNQVVNNQLFPLPPLAEQKRIVAKIEELLPLVDRYEQAWQRLEVLNSRFPVDMQKSVLQLAIQGRLVPQRPEEGTAEELFRQIQAEKQSLIQSGKIKKEKPLPEITEDEISFDIPESWKWVRLSELMYSISTGPFGSMLHKADYVSDGIPLVNPANIVNGRIVPSEKMMITPKTRDRLSSYILRNGMIVMGRRGEMGRCAVVTDLEDGWLCGTGSFFMEPSIELFVNYL